MGKGCGRCREEDCSRGLNLGDKDQERPFFEKLDLFWGGNGKAESFVTQFSFPHSRSPLTLFS